MARATVKQRYFVATQEVRDGKTILTLVEESKDTASCHNLMKSKEFAAAHANLSVPVRVCILRDEPAFMVQARPNALSQKVREAAGEKADEVLGILASNGVDVTGDLEVTEVDLPVQVQVPSQGPEDAPETAPVPPPVPEAPAAAPAPPEAPQASQASAHMLPPEKQVKFLDQLRIVPADYSTKRFEELLEIAHRIDSSIDGSCTRLACIAVISKYLETGQRNIAPAPAGAEPADPFIESPPDQVQNWNQVECPYCQSVVWQNDQAKMHDPVEDTRGTYPEHNCPGYLERQKGPAVPPGPPEGAVPPPAPQGQVEPPPAVAPQGGFTQGTGPSGQAGPPPPPRDIGVPPGPPPPPPPPPPPGQ